MLLVRADHVELRHTKLSHYVPSYRMCGKPKMVELSWAEDGARVELS
jgi:hypothetical protein